MQLILLIIIIAGGSLLGLAALCFLYLLVRGPNKRRQYGTLEEGHSLKERLVEPKQQPLASRSGRAIQGAEIKSSSSTTRKHDLLVDNDQNTMYAMNFLRSQSTYTLKTALKDIGHRREKHYFLVNTADGHETLLMSMTTLPRNTIRELNLTEESSRAVFTKVLRSIQHPFIQTVEHSAFFSGQGKTLYLFVISPWKPKGSIRDMLNKCRPEDSTQTKYYAEAKHASGFQTKRIAKYGAQVLEALSFLSANKYPYNHLHCGNLIVDGDVCQLADVQNPLSGVKPQVAPDVDGSTDHDLVIQFGRVLFEMATGYELGSNELVAIPESVPSQVKEVLHLIMKTDRVRNVDSLLKHKLFAKAGARVDSAIKDQAIFSSKCRDMLKTVRTQSRRIRRKTIEAVFADEEDRDAVRQKEAEKAQRREERAAEREANRKKKRDEIVAATRSGGSKTETSSKPAEPAAAPAKSSAPPPPPPARSSAPPPPPSSAPPAAMPAAQTGRSSLLDSIRNKDNMKKLKKVDS